jgi:hypothetical protein
MSVEYIWIDIFCLDQHDPGKMDVVRRTPAICARTRGSNPRWTSRGVAQRGALLTCCYARTHSPPRRLRLLHTYSAPLSAPTHRRRRQGVSHLRQGRRVARLVHVQFSVEKHRPARPECPPCSPSQCQTQRPGPPREVRTERRTCGSRWDPAVDNRDPALDAGVSSAPRATRSCTPRTACPSMGSHTRSTRTRAPTRTSSASTRPSSSSRATAIRYASGVKTAGEPTPLTGPPHASALRLQGPRSLLDPTRSTSSAACLAACRGLGSSPLSCLQR